MAQITYADKVALNVNAGVADINKVNDTDMNEIKTVVNNTVSSIGTGNDTFSSSTAYSSGDLVIYQNQVYKFTASHNGAWTGTDADLVPIINNQVINPRLIPHVVADVAGSGSSGSGNFREFTFSTINVYDSDCVGSSSSRLLIKKAGFYRITYSGRMSDGTGNCLCGIALNQTLNDTYATWGYSNTRLSMTKSFIVSLSANDTLSGVRTGTSISNPGVSSFSATVEYLGTVGVLS